MNSSHIALLSGLLLATIIALSGVMHRSMIDACSCVVNSAARASIALGVATFLGALLGIQRLATGRAAQVLHIVQLISFTAALFFLIQHVFFVLELA